MGKNNVIHYKEKKGNVTISVDIPTSLCVGDGVRFPTADVVDSYFTGYLSGYYCREQGRNTETVMRAFLIKRPDIGRTPISRHIDTLISVAHEEEREREKTVFPPYIIGRVTGIAVEKAEGYSNPDYIPLYALEFEVDQGDGEPPRKYEVKAYLRFGFKKVPYRVNVLDDFNRYKVWLARKQEWVDCKTKEFSEQEKEWEKENPCPM